MTRRRARLRTLARMRPAVQRQDYVRALLGWAGQRGPFFIVPRCDDDPVDASTRGPLQ